MRDILNRMLKIMRDPKEMRPIMAISAVVTIIVLFIYWFSSTVIEIGVKREAHKARTRVCLNRCVDKGYGDYNYRILTRTKRCVCDVSSKIIEMGDNNE